MTQTSGDGRVSFSEIHPRPSVDTMLRSTQQQLVALSGQAGLKASLLTGITRGSRKSGISVRCIGSSLTPETYRTIISDVYDQGVHLVRAKYRYLRASYTLFLLGFLSAGVAPAVSAAVR